MIIEDITDEIMEQEAEYQKKPEETISEPEGVNESRSRSSICYPCALGFFLQPKANDDLSHRNSKNPASYFLCTCEAGKEFKKGRWGLNIDVSLSFLGQEVDIVASSKSFLLCRANPKLNKWYSISKEQNMDYIICNPVTRQFRRLPRTHKAYTLAPLAFICKGDNITSLNKVEFEVIRAGVQESRPLCTTLEIEIYSSVTNIWTEASIDSDSPFALSVATTIQPFAVDGVVYWNTTHHCLLALDRSVVGTQQSAKLVKPPPRGDGGEFVCDSEHFGPSEGKVHYARWNYLYDAFELWVLEDYKRSNGWNLRERVSLKHFHDPPEYIRHIVGIDNVRRWGPQLVSFHPQNSHLIFVLMFYRPYWYNLKSRQRTEIVDAFMPFGSLYFTYEWPFVLSDDQPLGIAQTVLPLPPVTIA